MIKLNTYCLSRLKNTMKKPIIFILLTLLIGILSLESCTPWTSFQTSPEKTALPAQSAAPANSIPVPLPIPGLNIRTVIVDTGQDGCYDNSRKIPCPKSGEQFYGQDSQYMGNQPVYRNNGDGTIADINTGLQWVQARGLKITWNDAMEGAAACRTGGFNDWRMPTIKELYSLINFNGGFHITEAASVPYIDTRYFELKYGNESAGERLIDCQDWSATTYVSTTMGGSPTVFGVNFADGRIKGYPKSRPGESNTLHKMYVRYVRGNPVYGNNDFMDNGNGTVTDRATGLMWMKSDSGIPMNWQQALDYAENLKYAGYDDWRLPNAKELQSIVDYSRSPLTTRSAAIDPVFQATSIESYYWTSTTHLDGPANMQGSAAVYIAFGRAMGYMPMPPGGPPRSGQQPPGPGSLQPIDVHGAGAQRSDPKAGNPADFPQGRGPQGDDVRINNYVRCVRDAR
jgi:hypothetical protein